MHRKVTLRVCALHSAVRPALGRTASKKLSKYPRPAPAPLEYSTVRGGVSTQQHPHPLPHTAVGTFPRLRREGPSKCVPNRTYACVSDHRCIRPSAAIAMQMHRANGMSSGRSPTMHFTKSSLQMWITVLIRASQFQESQKYVCVCVRLKVGRYKVI